MYHHLAMFYTNDLADASVNVALGVVSDQILSQANSRYLAPNDMQVMAAYVATVGLVDARINAPSLRSISLPYIDPGAAVVAAPDVPPINVLLDNGYGLDATEEFTVEVSRTSGAAADAYAALWIAPRMVRAQPGPIYTVRATSSVTIAEGSWANGVLTLTQTLPPGRYQVVGMSAYGTNLFASRLVFPTGGLRPGVLAQQAIGQYNQPVFRTGNFGAFGEFNSYVLPSVDHFGAGAGTSQTVFLDLVRLGGVMR